MLILSFINVVRSLSLFDTHNKLQMCVECNNEISESAKTGMLLPCHLIFRHNDDTLLLPCKCQNIDCVYRTLRVFLLLKQ